MTTLNIAEIRQNLSRQLEVVEKTEALQKVVDRVFPGYQVTLTKGEETFSSDGVRIRTRPSTALFDLSQLPGIEQIERVLRENGQAMKLRDLHTKLVEEGGSMSLSTMMSLLSKYQKQDKFRRFGHALWGLPEQMGSPR